MSEEDSPLEQKARKVRNNWFSQLPEKERDNIIKPEFEKKFPTNADIKEAVKKYSD